MPSVAENAYFAGLLDGEGSIEVGYEKGIGKRRNYHPIITITNTHEGVCHRAKSLYGGCVHQRRKYDGKYKACYSWIIPSRKAERFLKLVYHFLIIKKEQAELVFKFYDEGIFRAPHRVSQEELMRRDTIRQKIKELHRR